MEDDLVSGDSSCNVFYFTTVSTIKNAIRLRKCNAVQKEGKANKTINVMACW